MFSYEDAGVSIEHGDMLTKLINADVKSDNIGNFAGLFEHPYIPEYYIVACTDGVGTKIIPLIKRGHWATIATDLIAMNLNDLICTGAKPMFFLDYLATNTLDVDSASKFVRALRIELEKYHCTLLGGETAELGNLIADNHFDVGGFMVGILKKEKLISKSNVEENDIIIGLPSSGPHSNGFSLIRKLNDEGLLSDEIMEEALAPTIIYSDIIEKLTSNNLVHAIAHITGGGIEGNLPRSIPEGLYANVSKESIPKTRVFEELKKLVGEVEAYKTFNMGVGMCVIVPEENCVETLEIASKYSPFVFGKVKKGITNEEKNTRICLR